MCDTIVVTSEFTIDGVTVFGKNSDREPNEAQYLLYVPAQDHPAGRSLHCTYIDIPQVSHTYAVLLSKPFWMWGAEMGVNEHGVAIGNEAVFTKIPYQKEGGLMGMDLLRLGLERGKTAKEALAVITALLDEYGQGGNCDFQHLLYYHNSFIIADPHDAWVLETAGPHWAAKQVRGVYTISNGITLGNEWDMASPYLVYNAIEKGWCKREEDFDFRRCYSDFLYTKFSNSYGRSCCTTDMLTAEKGNNSVRTVISALRDHGTENGRNWRPDSGLTDVNVCMHLSYGPVRINQNVGSLVCHLHPDHPTHFFTGTAAPCTSIYKPVWLSAELPDMGPEPKAIYDASTHFWQHEILHRSTLRDYENLASLYRHERDALESKFVDKAFEIASSSAQERSKFAAHCLKESQAAEAKWVQQVVQTQAKKSANRLYSFTWKKINQQAGINSQMLEIRGGKNDQIV